MANAIWTIMYNAKKSLIYELENEKDADKYDAIEKVYEKFAEILNKNDINIDKLWI
jgi:hypothetical protein